MVALTLATRFDNINMINTPTSQSQYVGTIQDSIAAYPLSPPLQLHVQNIIARSYYFKMSRRSLAVSLNVNFELN